MPYVRKNRVTGNFLDPHQNSVSASSVCHEVVSYEVLLYCRYHQLNAFLKAIVKLQSIQLWVFINFIALQSRNNLWLKIFLNIKLVIEEATPIRLGAPYINPIPTGEGHLVPGRLEMDCHFHMVWARFTKIHDFVPFNVW